MLNMDVYSGDLTNLIDSAYFSKTPEQYLIWGYIGDSRLTNNINITSHLIRQDYIDQNIFFVDSLRIPLNGVKKIFKDMHFLVAAPIHKGMSGSPVWLKQSKRNKKNPFFGNNAKWLGKSQ